MAEIPLSVDNSRVVDPLRETAELMREIVQGNEKVEKSFQDAFTASARDVDKTTNALKDTDDEQKKVAKTADGIKKEFSSLEKKKKDAYDGKEVKEFEDDVKKADRATDGLGDSLDSIPVGVFDELKGGIGELIGSIRGLKEETDDLDGGEGGGAGGGFGGILGKLGPIALGVGAVVGGIGAAVAGVVELDEKFDNLRGTVQRLFQTTEEETDRIVTNVEAIADTFDEEVNEVLLATNTLAKEFGISGVESSLLIKDGLNSIANVNGELLEGVKEYSSQIRAAGGDAQDLFNILELSQQEGVFSDKGVDVVKEFGLRIREQADGTRVALDNAFGAGFADDLFGRLESGTITSIDALAEVSEALGGLNENSKEAQTVIADVFGGAGEDAGFRFLTLLEDINEEQGIQNKQLTEEQQRKQETFEANQRLAGAQNRLSKAIGDSSAIGRIWIDIQTFFVEVLITVAEAINDVVRAFESMEGFVEVMLELVGVSNEAQKSLDEFNKTATAQDQIMRRASEAIQRQDAVGRQRIKTLQFEIDAIQNSAIADEKKKEIIEGLNEEYPELLKNIDLETASTEELAEVKKQLTAQILEEEVARKQLEAQRLLDIQIQQREAELARTVRGSERAKELEEELKFLNTRVQAQIDSTADAARVQLGLIERANDEEVADEELTEDEKNRINEEALAARAKIQEEFNNLIKEILKRGQDAFLNDQLVAQEERLKRQRDFQLSELQSLFDHARDLQEELTGSRELEQEVIDAFNLAFEKIENDFQDKILDIRRKANQKLIAEQLKFQQQIVSERQTGVDQEVAILAAREREELAVIEQNRKRVGQKERDFDREQALLRLDTQQFFLNERLKLIDVEFEAKQSAIFRELDAIEGKEGAEYDLKRKNLDRKLELLRIETDAQKEQGTAQVQNFQDQIDELENIKGPTLGQVFEDVQGALANAFNLDPEQLQAVTAALQQVAGEIFNIIQDSLSGQLEANQTIIDQLNERETELEESLNRELEFQAKGYANNVKLKQEELDRIRDAERAANEQRKELLAEQEKLDTVSQAVSLITASANLYKVLSPLPFGIGVALATVLTGAMLTAFLATKAKARNITSLAEGGVGDSQGMIKGKRHSHGGENFLDHVEVEDGEMFGVFNRKASKKYRDMISGFVDAVNNDNLDGFMPDPALPKLVLKRNGQLNSKEIELKATVMADGMGEHLAELPKIRKAVVKTANRKGDFVYQEGGETYLLRVSENGSKQRFKLKKA